LGQIGATSGVGRSTWPRRGQSGSRRTADEASFLDLLATEMELAPIDLVDRAALRRRDVEREPFDDSQDRKAFHSRLMPPGWREDLPEGYRAGGLFTLAG
jgi:hypothetical protein